jgi:hypothetical protein
MRNKFTDFFSNVDRSENNEVFFIRNNYITFQIMVVVVYVIVALFPLSDI